MIPGSLLGWLPLLLSVLTAQPGPVAMSVTRVVIQNEIILRVPLQPRPMFRDVEWVERKRTRCIPIAQIRQAMMSGPVQVDFILADHSRVRAHLDEDCPALDFYGSAYLQPEDDRLCAGRDAIHSRMGGSCNIEQFRRLEPKLRR